MWAHFVHAIALAASPAKYTPRRAIPLGCHLSPAMEGRAADPSPGGQLGGAAVVRADVGGGGTSDKAPPATPAGPPLAASPGHTPSSGVGPRTQLLFNDIVDVSGGASEGGEDEGAGGDLPQGGDAGGVHQFAANSPRRRPVRSFRPPRPTSLRNPTMRGKVVSRSGRSGSA
jgi:hypothetical protein